MRKSVFVVAFLFSISWAVAQTCPFAVSTNIGSNPDTYYPGQGSVLAGATSITLGAATSGTTPINAGDLVLIIQMQGAELNTANSDSYGDGVAGGLGSGYLNNANNRAGNMEFAVATNAVGLGGGTLNIGAGTANAYSTTNFGAAGQYRYQVIRVPVLFDATLTANISAPAWDGTTGGVLVIYARHNFNFNGFSLSAAAAGFRGGGSRQLPGGAGSNADYRLSATINANGPKGEGIAGTPQYVVSGGSLINTAVEGYPTGSHGKGAPGNAGGGATDGFPVNNDQNTGGGGGANGGFGGQGGNSWASNIASGGDGGSPFGQSAPSRVVMGGGGGGGSTNNGTGTPAIGLSSSGASGGGIVLLFAKYIVTPGTINVDGENANNTVNNDGSGGGGAGGSVLVLSSGGHANVTVTARGGTGGTNGGGGSPHGPGGGGSGGVVYSNASLNGATSVAGGASGLTAGAIPYGATDGAAGILVQNSLGSSFPSLSNACGILPVKLTGFAVQKKGNDVVLNWSAASEYNFKEYVIEQSTNGVSFTAVGTVAAKGSSTSIAYQYTDLNAASKSKELFYRLKLVDIDGSVNYSTIQKVRFFEGPGLDIRPTVVNRGLNIAITLSGSNAGSFAVRVLDINGKVVLSQQKVSGGQYLLNTQNLTKGVYMVHVMASDGFEQQSKIVVQ